MNSWVEDSIGSLGGPGRRRSLKHWGALKEDWEKNERCSDEQDLVEKLDSVAAEIAQLRRRHEAFQPLSPDQAERQKLFAAAPESSVDAKGPRSRMPASNMSPEEKRERFEILKYVRKIEPDLPPLERLPPCTDPPPDQALVTFNATPAALSLWRPDKRPTIVASRCAQENTHRREVAQQASRVKSAALARKRELGELRSAGPTQSSLGRPDKVGHWFVLCTVCSFAQVLSLDLRLQWMKTQERDEFVAVNWQQLLARKLPVITLAHTLAKMAELTQTAEFQERVPLLTCFFTAKLRIKRHRIQARNVLTCLSAWKSAGRMFLTVKRIGIGVRKLQRWWRTCSENLRLVLNEVSQRFVEEERSVLERELRQLLPWAKIDDTPAFEARVEKGRVSQRTRSLFLAHELRARRYFFLPRLNLWQEEMRHWEQDVHEWSVTRVALKELGEQMELLPTFSWPPVRPSYLPTDKEVQDMCRRAKKGRKGWTKIPLHSPSVTKGSSPRQSTAQLLATTIHSRGSLLMRKLTESTFNKAKSGDEDAPDEVEYLARLGVVDASMPGGLARPPPPSAECDED